MMQVCFRYHYDTDAFEELCSDVLLSDLYGKHAFSPLFIIGIPLWAREKFKIFIISDQVALFI